MLLTLLAATSYAALTGWGVPIQRALLMTAAYLTGRALGRETPIGWMPRYEDIHWDGLSFPKEKFDDLQKFDAAAWKQEVVGHEELFIELHDHLPKELIYERELLICRL